MRVRAARTDPAARPGHGLSLVGDKTASKQEADLQAPATKRIQRPRRTGKDARKKRFTLMIPKFSRFPRPRPGGNVKHSAASTATTGQGATSTTSPSFEPYPAPTMGRQAFFHTLNVKMNVYKKPKFSKREIATLYEQATQQDAERDKQLLIARLRYLAGLGIQPILSFCNVKSSSKTTAALYVASVIAEYTRKNVLLIPATMNTATVTAGVMAGLRSGNTITVSQYSRDIDQFGAYRAVSQRVPRTRFGLGVIAEDRRRVNDVNTHYGVAEFTEMVKTTLPNVDVLVLDHGNDNIERDSIVLAATRLSHVLNFPFMMDAPVTRHMLRLTIGGYNTDTAGGDKEMEGDGTGRSISTQEKVRRSIIIASRAPEGQVIDFPELARPLEQSADATHVPPWEGKGYPVQADHYISSYDETDNPSECDLTKIALQTLVQYLRIAVANFEMAAELTGVPVEPAPWDRKTSAQDHTPPADS